MLIEDRGDGPEATGVEYADGYGATRRVEADVVVVAAGSLRTPQVLMRSQVPNPNIGKHLGLHPAQFVFGLFDEPQDAHMVAPITGHCYDFAADEDGGFAVEAVTVQDPIGFAATLCDENGPMWGQPLVDAAEKYRHWIGLLNMSNDDNNASVSFDGNGNELFLSDFQPGELGRISQRARVLDPRAGGGRRHPDPVVGARHHPHAGELPDGRGPRHLGGRHPRRVARGQAALRRGQLGSTRGRCR